MSASSIPLFDLYERIIEDIFEEQDGFVLKNAIFFEKCKIVHSIHQCLKIYDDIIEPIAIKEEKNNKKETTCCG